MTFSQYLNRVKVEEAVRLLRENKGLPVTEIAFRCGFNTIRNFNRIFKEVTGCTPRSLPKTYVPDEKFIYSVSGDFRPHLAGNDPFDRTLKRVRKNFANASFYFSFRPSEKAFPALSPSFR